MPVQSKSQDGISKYVTGEYNRGVPESSAEPKSNLNEVHPRGAPQTYSLKERWVNPTDYISQISQENELASKYYDNKHKYLKSFDKENTKLIQEGGLYLSRGYTKQDNMNERIYLSDKYYKDRSLEFSGNNKLRTSIKERPGKDLAILKGERADKESLGSPISFQTEQDPGIYEEAINYYQQRETKGRSTFERHPYE